MGNYKSPSPDESEKKEGIYLELLPGNNFITPCEGKKEKVREKSFGKGKIVGKKKESWIQKARDGKKGDRESLDHFRSGHNSFSHRELIGKNYRWSAIVSDG